MDCSHDEHAHTSRTRAAKGQWNYFASSSLHYADTRQLSRTPCSWMSIEHYCKLQQVYSIEKDASHQWHTQRTPYALFAQMGGHIYIKPLFLYVHINIIGQYSFGGRGVLKLKVVMWPKTSRLESWQHNDQW